tara:strand:- start:301 stop:1461 length:1161 start_codon:yes stop_codon:yes gene_type:complete
MATLYDWCLRISKAGMFSSATGFSSASSFFCNDAEPPLTWLSAAGFTSTALYSLVKNLGVAEEITRQIDANACLRRDVNAILGDDQQELLELIDVPPRVVESVPTHLFSDKTLGFNQFTNGSMAMTAILMTWVASYHTMNGYNSVAMVIAAVSFALMHMVCAHYLRQAMNKLMIESEVLTQQGLGLAYFAKGDIQRALPLFKKADQLADKLPGPRQAAGDRLTYVALQQAHQQHARAMNNRFRAQTREFQTLLNDQRHANWCLRDELREEQRALNQLKQYVRALQRDLDIEIDDNVALRRQLGREVYRNVRLRDVLFHRDDEIERLERRCHELRVRNIRLADRLVEQDDWRWAPRSVQAMIIGRGINIWVEEVQSAGELYQQLRIQ